MYFSNVSTGFMNTLTKHNLTNVFDPNNIYFRDTNHSYNKIDGFITKHIKIFNENGMLYKENKNNDIMDIKDIEDGKYTITISYTFNIPEHYVHFVQDLEKKYEIQINDREMAILGLKSGMYDEE